MTGHDPQPAVTVVIPTLNRRERLERAVHSVLGQKYRHLELIVVDNGSTDGTHNYLMGINDPRVNVVRTDQPGPSAARNAGLAVASGDWITFLDDDDEALPNWLSAFVENMRKGVGAVCCSASFYREDGTLDSVISPWNLGPMFGGIMASTLAGAYAVRTHLIRDVGGFDTRLLTSEQTEMWMRLAWRMEASKLAVRVVDQSLVRLEWRPKPQRLQSSPNILFQGASILISKHSALFERDKASRADVLAVKGVAAARMSDWSEARAALWDASRSQPHRMRMWLRFLAACVPLVGRRIWRVDDYRSKTGEDHGQ